MAKKLREIIHINEDLCDGCGQCILSCDEGAIQIIDGKAKLVSENLCDGFGNCLGSCPQDAITIEKQVAEDFDEEAVKEHLAKQTSSIPVAPKAKSCPGSAVQSFPQMVPKQSNYRKFASCPGAAVQRFGTSRNSAKETKPVVPTQLTQWPVQLMLVPPTAPFLKGRELLLAADCCPTALADFHNVYLKGKSLLIGCPKFDDMEHYRQKLEEIFRHSGCTTITVMIMEVPCCGGFGLVARDALVASGNNLPLKEVIVGIRGDIIRETIIQT